MRRGSCTPKTTCKEPDTEWREESSNAALRRYKDQETGKSILQKKLQEREQCETYEDDEITSDEGETRRQPGRERGIARTGSKALIPLWSHDNHLLKD